MYLINKIPNNYLALAILSSFLVPIMGLIPLTYAVNVKYALYKKADEQIVNNYLLLCYKWIKITVITFAVIFPLLVLSLVLINFLY